MNAIAAYIRSLPKSEQSKFHPMYLRIPPEIARQITISSYKAGATVIRMQQPACMVYLLLQGRVTVVNEQSGGSIYAFAHLEAPAAFGELEAFSDAANYRATIHCATPCVIASLSSAVYLTWLRGDSEALFSCTQQITRQMALQAASERSFLFISGTQRLALYLTEAYEKAGMPDKLVHCAPRQQIADEIGFSMKTVQRGLKELEARNLISKNGRAIGISHKQYQHLSQFSKEAST